MLADRGQRYFEKPAQFYWPEFGPAQGLVSERTVSIDATTPEANAALKNIVRRDNGQSYNDYLKDLALAAGIEQIATVKNDKKLVAENPLIDRSGRKTVPNVTRVFRMGQNLTVYFEVYDPGTLPEDPSGSGRPASVAANLTLFDGTYKVMDTPQVHVTRLDSKRDNVIPVRLRAPFNNLKPGRYTCQVNVIDELGRKFSFPRTLVFVMAGAEAEVSK
jgi:hypothetical protein